MFFTILYTFAERVKYDLTSDVILFRTVLKVKCFNNNKAVFYFIQVVWFLICQWCRGLGGLSDVILWERSYWFSTAGQFFVGFSFFGNCLFQKQKNHQHTRYSLLQSLNTPPTPSTPWSHLLTSFKRGWRRRSRSRRK